MSSDHENNQKKKAIWMKIEAEFNLSLITDCYRPVASLNIKFKNMCRRVLESK